MKARGQATKTNGHHGKRWIRGVIMKLRLLKEARPEIYMRMDINTQ
jgi:hypothetical protein